MTTGKCLAITVMFLFALIARAEKAPQQDISRVDADFALQGEYAGEMTTDQGEKIKVGAQVIAMGDGKFQLVGYPGGLPGEGWTKNDKSERVEAQAENGVIVFTGERVIGTLKEGTISAANKEGKQLCTLKKVVRESPTLGAKPPTGALVLFDGKNVDAWKNGRMTEEGLLMEGTETKQTFKDCTLHVEFRLPYMPKARGQGRGNSGCYLMGRYEVQILDSFGLEGKNNEAGGIYTISDPLVNMCFPPLAWQTYDIEFAAPRFDADGKKLANAKMTVHHNGVLVQKDVEVSHPTTAAPYKETPDAGPVYFQNHTNPMRFRNIWIVAK